MSVYLFFIFLALLNIGMGFGLGVYLRRRYELMTSDDLWDTDEDDGRLDTTSSFGEEATAERDAAATSDAAAALDTLADLTSGPEPAETAGETPEQTSAESIEETSPEPGEEPADEAADDTAAEEDGDSQRKDSVEEPQVPAREVSAGEASIARMQEGVTQYHEMLTATDDELREHAQQPDAAAIEATFTSLQTATRQYVDDRDRAHGDFEEAHRDHEQSSGIRDDLQAAMERQNVQIETFDDLMEAFDYEEDLDDGCRQMVDETSKLIEVNHQLRDTLDQAMAGAARNEQSLAEVDPALRDDPLTGLANRTGLEAQLIEWWQKDPHRHRSLSAAMYDVDNFGRINQQHGQKVGDKLIRAVAEFIESNGRGATISARLAGQRFLILFGDTDTRFATDVVERVRQSLEMVCFDYNGEEIRLTLSCAVVEVTAEDTSDSLITRAETALKEAKRCGRNRTFGYEGELPTAVIPPNLPLEETRIPL